MTDRRLPPLSRRERQIMDVVYRAGSATASDVHAQLPDAPSYSAVRAILRILEEKGHLTHTADGPRYVFAPVVPRNAARQSALRQVVRTFFDGSATDAVATLLDMQGSKISGDELEELAKMIERARKEGK
jgi:BlaI family transcriptional regulator, penicillinase repressor